MTDLTLGETLLIIYAGSIAFPFLACGVIGLATWVVKKGYDFDRLDKEE